MSVFCQNVLMRMTPAERQVIRDASLRYFGVRPRLFGPESITSNGAVISICTLSFGFHPARVSMPECA